MPRLNYVSRDMGQKTVIVPGPVHKDLVELQEAYREELGRTVVFGEIIERAVNLLKAMRAGGGAPDA